MNLNLSSLTRRLTEFVRPATPGPAPLPLGLARELVEHIEPASLFSYRAFDDDNKFCYLSAPNGLAMGFMLAITPMMVAGVDAEPQFEAAISALPSDSVVQVGKLSSTQTEWFITRWAKARMDNNPVPLLRMATLRRARFLLETATGDESMLPSAKLHPRMMQWYVAVRIPFTGDPKSPGEVASFISSMGDYRNNIKGALTAIGVQASALGEFETKFLLRELANQHLTPQERLNGTSASATLAEDILQRGSRLTVRDDGRIGIQREAGEIPDIVVTAMTVDGTPNPLYLPMMAATLGNPASAEERITCPYWAYTTIHVLHPDDARDALVTKLGLLNKQTMTDSAWFRSMMGHLFDRKDRANALLGETSKGHTLVRAYTGINLYTTADSAKQQTQYVAGLYRNAGFRLSEEKYIGLPAYLASFPLQYVPEMDQPNKGMQRAWLMTSLNAASMLQVQGDWRGTGEEKGGLMLTSRSGQLATIDLLQTSTNYNFVVVAQSGSGKSFLTNEIINDFLSKGGIARVIDVGRSYFKFCERVGGENIVFSPDRPMSLNPFTGITTREALNEMMPMLKDLLRLMAYPLTLEEDTPAYQYQLLEKAISEAWEAKGESCELQDVVAWLSGYQGVDQSHRAQDLALQLEPFSSGRYKRWFTGPRTVEFTKSLVVLELEELRQDSALQAVVMQLMMFQVTRDMYLSDRRLPKLLVIDEAWDLMAGLKTGRFIETAFRRIRKYNGIAGVITQSFEDFEKSPAARATIENAAWQFILAQRPESIDHAVTHKRISSDESTVKMIKTVRSGAGFSEIYIRSETGSGIYRFVTDPYTYFMYTTKPSDLAAIANLQDAGRTLEQAVDELAQQEYLRRWGRVPE